MFIFGETVAALLGLIFFLGGEGGWKLVDGFRNIPCNILRKPLVAVSY